MDEYFLQYLWQFQKFDQQLVTTTGEKLTVFNTGFQNHHSGPDFQDAKLKIGELLWTGSVEVHYASSDWKRHLHHRDKAYDNVILHVVWKHDEEVLIDGQPIPTFELVQHVKHDLTDTYRRFINQPSDIICHSQFATVADIHQQSMLDRALVERLKEKSQIILGLLKENQQDWEETAYQVLAKNFGFKTNASPFEKLSKTLPFSVLHKNLNDHQNTQALLFGMAGFLEASDDPFQQKLLERFQFLTSKHQLTQVLEKHHWKTARLRPANFPSIRLAQMAALLHAHPKVFQEILEINDLKSATSFFRQPVDPYWEKHLDFNKPSDFSSQLGTSSIASLIINSIVPILSAYAKYIGEVSYLEKAELLLESLPFEQNSVTKKWKELGIVEKNAATSQALIQQYNHYCKPRKCLHCAVGLSIVNQSEI